MRVRLQICFIYLQLLHLHLFYYAHVYIHVCILYMGFPDGSMVKNLPAVQVTRVRSLGQKEPLEKGVATHSSTLARQIPMDGGG